MARRPRIHLPGAFYHVTLRGNHRQRIFHSDRDLNLLGTIVTESLQRAPARIHAYCWMPNHLHMLIQAGDDPIGRLVLRIASRYARTVQGRIPTTGHLFERRYHSVLVDADAYLLTLLRYIHLNPVRAGMVASVGEYEWSSHHAYLGTRRDVWVTTDFALGMWHGNEATARKRYRRFMSKAFGPASPSPLERVNRSDPRILGDDNFAKRIADATDFGPDGTALEKLIVRTCAEHAITPDELRSPRRLRRLAGIRAQIAHEALARKIATASQVARRFNRSESTIRALLIRHFERAPS